MAFASLFNEVSQSAFAKMLPFIQNVGASVGFLFVNLLGKPADPASILAEMDHNAQLQEIPTGSKQIHDHQEAEKGSSTMPGGTISAGSDRLQHPQSQLELQHRRHRDGYL